LNGRPVIDPVLPPAHAQAHVQPLRALDHVQRADHPYLSSADRCSFLLEWRCGSRIVRDFKRPPSAVAFAPRRAAAKAHAVAVMADLLRAAVSRRAAEAATWVPIPPSKAYADCEFDDRLTRTLALAFRGYDVDLRPLLFQVHSTLADHQGSPRLSAHALLANLRVDLKLLHERPLRDGLALFDDVLTTGKHYKCCERRLREQLPETAICGVFLLRRAMPHRWRGRY
jgi:predicted amidophosphoribosyltransferase